MSISLVLTRRRLRRSALALAWPSAIVPILGAPIAQAADVPSAALPPMFVTAARAPQPLPEVLADVTVLDRAAIEQSGAVGVADLLARQPGIEISRNGGPGTNTSVFIRGAETRFTAVYLDGVRLDSQSTGGAVWESIPLSLIERIEILRGPAAAVYGSDAMAGVIALFTRRGEGALQPSIRVGAGTYATRGIDAALSGASGGWDYALSLAHQRSDGFNARTVATANPDRDGYESDSASMRLGYDASAQHRLELTALSSRLDSQYDGFLPGADDRNRHKLETVGLGWRARWNDALTSRFSVTDARQRYETEPSPYLTITHLRNLTAHNEWRQGAQRATLVLERREDALQNAPIDRSRAQNAVAAGWGYLGAVHSVQLNLRHDDDSEFGGKATGSVAYGYAWTPSWRATVAAGTAFRVPTLYQRFSVYGQPTLVPETARNVELGLKYAQGSDAFSAVLYRNRVRNLISFGAPGGCASSFGCYTNTARAQYEGLTLSGQTRWAGVDWRASLDLQNPRDETTGKRLARRAREHAFVGADLQWAGWRWGAEWQLSAMRYDDAANKVALGGYGLLNLTASRPLTRDWTLSARLDNLADKSYQLANTYATPGRSLWLALQWAPR
ncbi:TonB-dependent receptor [Tibeticola sp.]|uniref:TonB-dependent receptor domain-containing protein n=1 Tax=Tibeticola sp. TaxID=2005368 RepID=UPI002582E47A|nr:TonB-dependent receptor [Tibeticola sp.]MCI4441225.1 TonB-dependent receptor [Tibeticola sp.]